MNKEFDYKKLYLTVYKNIPNIVFISTFCLVELSAIVAGIFFYYSFLGFLFLIGGLFVAWLLASIDRFIAAVAISQKVVMTDALLSMQSGNYTSEPEQKVNDTQNTTDVEEANDTQKSTRLWFIGKCEMCGLDSTKVTYTSLSDEMGTRYRNTCKSCFEKYNFKIEKK